MDKGEQDWDPLGIWLRTESLKRSLEVPAQTGGSVVLKLTLEKK